MGQVLSAESVFGHGLFFNMYGKSVLVRETATICNRVLWALYGESHVIVRNIDIHLRIGWPGY